MELTYGAQNQDGTYLDYTQPVGPYEIDDWEVFIEKMKLLGVSTSTAANALRNVFGGPISILEQLQALIDPPPKRIYPDKSARERALAAKARRSTGPAPGNTFRRDGKRAR